ncbi:MAG: anhydro-N-acetylmuramic acid kinase [Planctomycetaceae bacterium]|jgi:anhydro-N-acetylmuramic acid kinase|nr:anhydro-N-acetylmuramic acid kinase [Planctomycetaceae bacterium]
MFIGFSMSLIPFHNPKKNISSFPRWFAGISIASHCRRIESALIGVHGQGSGAPIEIRKTISFDLPHEITESYNNLQETVLKNTRGNRATSTDIKIPSSLLFHVLRELASVEEEAIDELLGESRLAKNDLLAVGIYDSGIRCRTASGGLYYQSLCDAPFLAEQTGLNIVDAFPLQDIASGGKGGPLFPLPIWIFLKSESSDRVLLDLGRTAKLTFLPKAENSFSHQRITQRDLIPCGSLLDTLTWELTGGETSIDLGGRLTVQGCQIPALLSELRGLVPPEEVWNPYGLPVDRYLKVVAKSTNDGHSYQDVLCTTSHFIAETITKHLQTLIAEHTANDHSEPEILVSGSVRMHGMMMNQISSQLRRRPMTPITHLDIPTETFDSLCTAMLTLMAVEHIPASLPHLTGSETTKPLGRITAGSITNWHRLLREMAQTKPTERPLRSVI